MMQLLYFKGGGFYFKKLQILSYGNHFFWLQERYEDSFGTNLIGQYIVDGKGNARKTRPGLVSYEFNCRQLAEKKFT